MISFITAIKNRLYQFEQVFDVNMNLINRYNHEWSICDYGSTDGLEEFLSDKIKNSNLIYTKVDEKYFHACKSRNIAALKTKYNIICNLDADNYLNSDFIRNLLLVYNSYDNKFHFFLQLHPNNYNITGSFGRMAFNRQLFFTLGGYDEKLYPIGGEDNDIIDRCEAYTKVKKYNLVNSNYCLFIPNSNSDSIVNIDPEILKEINNHWYTMVLKNYEITKNNISLGKLIANQ